MSDINIVLENRDDIHVAVEEKDINVEVPAGKDGRSLRPRGEWSASVAYAYLDLVSYEGSSYVATKAVPAGTLPTDTSYWMLSAEKGEPGGSVWGLIAGDLSDQTDLQDALDAKADVIISSASGSIASFSDGSASPVTALSVSIDPVQDLHGYDNPWPAGGGANRWDEEWEVGGLNTSNGGNWNTVDRIRSKNFIPINPSTAYYIKYPTAGVAIDYCFYDSTKTFISAGSYVNQAITTPSNAYYMRFATYAQYGSTYHNDIAINYPSTVTTYQPYSNICPISGHTSATVTRTGKNVLSLENIKYGSNSCYNLALGATLPLSDTSSNVTYTVQNGAVTVTNTANWRGISIISLPLKKGTYELSFSISSENKDNTKGSLYLVDENYKILSKQMNYANYKVTYYTYTITVTDDNSRFVYSLEASTQFTYTVSNLQLELGSTATAYELPSIQTVTIDLNGTRYGGVLNLLTGEMTVEYGIKIWTSENHFNPPTSQPNGYYTFIPSIGELSGQPFDEPCLCNMLEGISYNDRTYSKNCIFVANGNAFVNVNFASTAAELKQYLSDNNLNIQLRYKLLSPITIQLTPSQMQTLLGENRIWADTGDTEVTYRTDTKLYIDSKVAQTAKVTRKMIADSATADGKAPKSLATGDLIIVGDELRKATANIGNGSAITASNSTTATLADVIKALQ